MFRLHLFLGIYIVSFLKRAKILYPECISIYFKLKKKVFPPPRSHYHSTFQSFKTHFDEYASNYQY